ncbi:hypothetical protein NDU88_002101 [Pleurodeles waltl]|uniref:Uncharacterized protein n=1 Tax=Pleurodeles waltl TaxID=8319 RepID=A0AAV7RCT6_PLEWA|nr:hypothetical protein NDU88_002101 [Pleurodeles waltl]
MDNNRVIQALNILHIEGREDLLFEGVLEHAWVCLKRPKRASSEGVAGAVTACVSPQKSKKFKQKSVSGRKVSVSPERDAVRAINVEMGLPARSIVARRGGLRFAQRSGASLRQRVAGRGRDMNVQGAVAAQSRMGARIQTCMRTVSIASRGEELKKFYSPRKQPRNEERLH